MRAQYNMKRTQVRAQNNYSRYEIPWSSSIKLLERVSISGYSDFVGSLTSQSFRVPTWDLKIISTGRKTQKRRFLKIAFYLG